MGGLDHAPTLTYHGDDIPRVAHEHRIADATTGYPEEVAVYRARHGHDECWIATGRWSGIYYPLTPNDAEVPS